MISLLAQAQLHKSQEPIPTAMIVFFVVWGILGIGNYAFLHFNRSAPLKRKAFRITIVLGGIIFCGFAYWIIGWSQPAIMLALIPAIILISCGNLRSTRFCDACGRTLWRQPIFARAAFCPRCGAPLK